MARPSDRRARPSADGRRRYGWRRPRWRDPAFWVAVGITVALALLQLVLVNWDAGWVWLSLVVRTVIIWFVISACIRIRVGIKRGLVDGFHDAEQIAASRPAGSSRGESAAKAGGRLAGRALGAAKRSRR